MDSVTGVTPVGRISVNLLKVQELIAPLPLAMLGFHLKLKSGTLAPLLKCSVEPNNSYFWSAGDLP